MTSPIEQATARLARLSAETARRIDAAHAREQERKRRQKALRRRLLAYIEAHPGCSWSELYEGVRGDHRRRREALDHLIARGRIRVEVEGRAHRHWVAR